jgi:probable phosphomutase (TIGR03848 family)
VEFLTGALTPCSLLGRYRLPWQEMSPRPKPPPPTVLVLVRHGLTPTTGRDLPAAGDGPGLSEEGRRQAEEAAQCISEWRAAWPPLKAIYNSPLTRTRETAAILAKALDMTPVDRADLVDCNAGEWAGAPLKDLAKKPEWSRVVHYPSGFRFPGGESIRQMHDRIVAGTRELVSMHPGESLVLVSHADPIKAVVAEALGLHLDMFQRILISPASVSAISYSDLSPSVMLVNWTGASGRLPQKGAPATGGPGAGAPATGAPASRVRGGRVRGGRVRGGRMRGGE